MSCNKDSNNDSGRDQLDFNFAEINGYEFVSEEFRDFYIQFHTDSLFQVNHIQFPLQGLPDLYSPGNGDKLPYFYEKEDWKFQKIINLAEKDFSQMQQDKIIVIEETLSNQESYGFVRRFTKDGDSWKLIFYSGYNYLTL